MKSFVPQYLHKPNKVMMLDMDEFAVFANAVAMGIILKSLIVFIIGVFLFFAYRKAKNKYPRGFLRHIPYIVGLKQFHNFPNIFIRSFKE
ncbi:type IV conjugative transfer system protein TraL [Seleniivibrio woodruffii]|uniref:Type IV conjugative transfer system protein TraL n=1 Tax=Seleniivibrio woodruffii TaxID=1078050 RepID=A0A4R1K302_9BACT|nr:type IV conjugative transfer system protein TraL [Seleniivibrio woodruffii]TCK58446.1 type IV conjugative transfer system protein TraL [Seleniivibrio woodruffii]TVZ36819.1 type IV conjugative transfer system protein TraL [Seleniivibrio woodruffii]